MSKTIEPEVKAAARRSKLLQSKNPLKNILGCIETFEGGCSNTFGHSPETCATCTRAFVKAVRAVLKKNGVQ